MDRAIVYAGAIPLDTDQLSQNRNAMIALGVLIKALLGISTLCDGLACTPTAPASLQVLIAPGSVYALENVDSTAYGSLAADTTHQIVKQGVSLSTLTINCPTPGTTGQSINYLIQAAYQDADTGPVVLPYYNSANPAVAYNGPNNSGTSQNTVRQGQCVVTVKAGVAANTGSQVTPAPDAGYIGLFVVTVANGQTQIVSGNISTVAGAPFISEKLGDKISLATGDARYLRAGTGIRTQLSASATFYISSTGSDSTGNGTSGSPWLTRQHAWNAVQATYDLNGQNVLFQIVDGTYTDSFIPTGMMVGQYTASQVVFSGNAVTPGNVVLNCTAGAPFGGTNAAYKVQNLEYTNTGGNGIYAQNGATIVMGAGLITGACNGTKIRADYGGQVFVTSSYTDVGSAQQHYETDYGGRIVISGGINITESGTPAYSVAFAVSQELGDILFQNSPTAVATFTGAATGSRYAVSLNGVIQTQGSGASYLPGSTAGSFATGGQYS